MSLFLIFFMLALLSACSNKSNYDYETLVNEVREIKIVYVIQEWGSLEYNILVEIDEQDMEIFLLELSKQEFEVLVFGDRGDLSDETCIMLIYENGAYDLISPYLTVRFHENDESFTWEPHNFNRLEFNKLIEKYTQVHSN